MLFLSVEGQLCLMSNWEANELATPSILWKWANADAKIDDEGRTPDDRMYWYIFLPFYGGRLDRTVSIGIGLLNQAG
jgi:hypothetical protein